MKHIFCLLFVIGLELKPQRLWTMRRAVFGLGGVGLDGTEVESQALLIVARCRAVEAHAGSPSRRPPGDRARPPGGTAGPGGRGLIPVSVSSARDRYHRSG